MTLALDPFTRHDLVERAVELAGARRFAVLVISPYLSDAARLGSRFLVLCAGETIELGSTERVTAEPAHPYSWTLVNAYPVMSTTKDVRPIRGAPPDRRSVSAGLPVQPPLHPGRGHVSGNAGASS